MAIITLDDLRAHLDIQDGVDDSTLTAAVAAANQAVAHFCGRDFDTTATSSPTVRLYRAQDGGDMLTVDDFWSTTGLVVKTDDDDDGTYETTWTLNTDFVVGPIETRRAGQTWPYCQLIGLGTKSFPTSNRRPAAVQVTAAWGWADVPDPVVTATLLVAARLWKRKNSPEGVLGGFSDFSPVRVSMRDDPDAAMLLREYRTPARVVFVG